MERLIYKYLSKLHQQGLADKEKVTFIALDAELFTNKPLREELLELSKLFEVMNINSILFSEPSEPYKSIINELTEENYLDQIIRPQFKDYKKNNSETIELDRITPLDCETRTFLHDIPVIKNFSFSSIAQALSIRKSAIIKNHGIIAYGTITPEQAYISYSSTCFAAFVKYFLDALNYFEYCSLKKINPNKRFLEAFKKIVQYLLNSGLIGETQNRTFKDILSCLLTNREKDYQFSASVSSNPQNEQDVINAILDTGKAVVKYRLVDSYFGNISYIFEDKIYISQTGSSMDELEGCIDAVSLDGSSSIGITSSSELSTHKNIYYKTGYNAILHGHPLFSVIMSMYCSYRNCQYFANRRICHIGCKEERLIYNIPIVSGEIGTGSKGIVNTVPLAIKYSGGVIVYGHGVFTSGKDNFYKPLSLLLDIEKICQREYFRRINDYIKLDIKHLFQCQLDTV